MSTETLAKWKIIYKPALLSGYDATVVDEENNLSVKLSDVDSFHIEKNDCVLQIKTNRIRLSNVKGQLHEIFLGMHHQWKNPPEKKISLIERIFGSYIMQKIQEKTVRDAGAAWCIIVMAKSILLILQTALHIQSSSFFSFMQVITTIGFFATSFICAVLLWEDKM